MQKSLARFICLAVAPIVIAGCGGDGSSGTPAEPSVLRAFLTASGADDSSGAAYIRPSSAGDAADANLFLKNPLNVDSGSTDKVEIVGDLSSSLKRSSQPSVTDVFSIKIGSVSQDANNKLLYHFSIIAENISAPEVPTDTVMRQLLGDLETGKLSLRVTQSVQNQANVIEGLIGPCVLTAAASTDSILVSGAPQSGTVILGPDEDAVKVHLAYALTKNLNIDAIRLYAGASSDPTAPVVDLRPVAAAGTLKFDQTITFQINNNPLPSDERYKFVISLLKGAATIVVNYHTADTSPTEGTLTIPFAK